MTENATPLQALEVGSYLEVASRPNPEKLRIQFVPALAAILASIEKTKGSPLTQTQVEKVRNKATVVAVPQKSAHALDEHRNYQDIDPEHAWRDWQRLRHQLGSST